MLFFSHCRKMNDLTEFKHADPFFLETIKKAIDDLLYGENKISNLPDSIDYEELKKELAKDFQDILSDELGEDFYIFSSTQHRVDYEKDHGSLVMWRGYGKENGCSIVFDKNQLESIIKKGRKNRRYGEFISEKIKYLHMKSIEKIEKAFGKTYKNFYKNLRINLSAIIVEACIGEKYEEKIEDYILPLITIKSLLKHPAFNSEKEYRMGIFPNIDRNDDGNLIKVKGRLIPVKNGRIELPIAEQGFPIKKIIVSPIGDQEKNYKVLSEFIQSDPRYHGIEVTKSEIPHQ